MFWLIDTVKQPFDTSCCSACTCSAFYICPCLCVLLDLEFTSCVSYVLRVWTAYTHSHTHLHVFYLVTFVLWTSFLTSPTPPPLSHTRPGWFIWPARSVHSSLGLPTKSSIHIAWRISNQMHWIHIESSQPSSGWGLVLEGDSLWGFLGGSFWTSCVFVASGCLPPFLLLLLWNVKDDVSFVFLCHVSSPIMNTK